MDPFVVQLARLCTTHRTRAKWVFVPTHALGRTLGERIALEGTNWLNLRFVTPLDIALRMGAPFLVERGIDPSEEGLGSALIMRLLLDLPERDGYFRALADQPTMAQALWSTLRELRMAGVKADDLQADAFESLAKHGELRALLAAYERHLEGERRGDMALVYLEALAHPAWCPIQPQDCWTELPHTNWNPLQRRLIDAMPGERISPPVLALPGRQDGGASVFAEATAGKNATLLSISRGIHEGGAKAPPLRVQRGIDEGGASAFAEATADKPFDSLKTGAPVAPVRLASLAQGRQGGEAPLRRVPGVAEAPPLRIWQGGHHGDPLDSLRPGGSLAPLRLAPLPQDRQGGEAPPLRVSHGASEGRAQAPRVDTVAPERATHPLAFLMTASAEIGAEKGTGPFSEHHQPKRGQSPFPQIELFHAGGREAEIEEVFRRILRAGVSLDHVEIACASDAQVALVWEKALRHDWPVTLGPGIAAAQTRPGRALTGLCDWIETDFAAGRFRRLLQSGDLGIEPKDEGFTAGEAARLLARADAGWGRATYGLALGRLRRDYEARAVDPDASDDDRADAQAKAALTARVLAWITGLVASIPEPATDDQVPLQAVVEAALAFIEHTTARKSALDHRAASALIEYVGELRALGPFECLLPGALRFIRERVQSLQVAPERPRPGHLYACTLAQAGYAGRPHVFVVGLEEGRVFPSAAEDAVLLDAERQAISPDLRTSTDRIDEAVYAVLVRLAVSGQVNVTFSYSSRDTREFRETYASWLMLQVFRVQQSDPGLSYQELKAALGGTTSVVSPERDAASSLRGWWLRSILGTGSEGIDAVGAAFGGLALGRTAAEARDSGAFTEFDGHVPEAGPVLDPCAVGTALSVTELEGVAGCPFRFFLKRGLGIRPVDERERDRDVWLDPLTRGSELHELYASFLRRCRDGNRRADDKQDAAWLKRLAQARLTELHREMPAATLEILERETKDFFADVELFLEAECANSASTPIGFEVSFGRPLEGAREPLDRAEPVEIDLGNGLTFRIAGRIDRIDRVDKGGDASFEVLDYKTGGFWRDSWKGTFAGGRRLQHALYGLAAVELLKRTYKDPKVTAGVYYFSSHKGRRERVRIDAPGQVAIARVLGDLRELIVQGGFVHSPNEEDCKFCDYSAACGGGAHQQADGKLQDSKLKAYGKLGAHV